ncbi:Hydroxyisourate hydrolase [Meredithblackwellia eburnea MCA 4105]
MSKASISQPQPRGSPITCHVLDSTNGKPAPEMRIRLDRLNTTGFTLLAQGVTDGDGRCKNLLQSAEGFEAGIFKITFFTSEYFTKRGLLSFYPFVEIPFEVKNPEEHYHVPLLLSPYAYSTYRGS